MRLGFEVRVGELTMLLSVEGALNLSTIDRIYTAKD